MVKKVKDFIIENNLLNKGDRVLVGLSGGPDSVCLLHILYNLKNDLEIELGAAHINHMLRGNEAIEDEEYSKRLCESLNIEFFSTRINIHKISKEKGISEEMAGREERYSFFDKIKEQEGYNKIAIAHNLNDHAETVILNLMRGSGMEGLCGIRVKREGGIIRPILCLSRDEIEEYCRINDLNPRIDKTNLENIYGRNKIRHDILPYMKKNFNDDIIETINRMSKLIQIDNDYLNKEVEWYYSKYCEKRPDNLIILKDAFSLDLALLTRLIRKSLFNFSEKYNNIEMKHIYEVIELSKNTTNKRIYLPNNIICENVYGDIYLKDKIKVLSKENNKEENEVIINKIDLENNTIEYNGYLIEFKIINNLKNNIEFSNNVLIKYFDYDNIKEELKIRQRRNGDKMIPLGMKNSKKLKDIFINLKIPSEERKEVPIVVFDDEIAWIVGYRVSESFKVTNKTSRILKITFRRKEKSNA
ncbi:tRNA lysidine(34) synthetase TilS [Clostridium isatidis]|uniref:tRNA lysidine(34) synthetase TilS n=1 Tax=Clostridium isatidis TaxID=182773 RepID=UPI003AB0B3F6